MSQKGRVLVAMSGGVDSSVAALMLHEQGYEVIGFTLKTWDYSSSGSKHKETGCCSLDSINDARQVAVRMGFKHFVLDVREEFEKKIVSNFIDEYLVGHTPNPCVLCNTFIKWELLLNKADATSCDYIATGHYACVREENKRFVLSKGIDELKDQSYVLWGLKQSFLSRTIFPLGNITKTDIKSLARKSGFDNLSDKSESYEICFIPDDDYRSFLEYRIPGLKEKYNGGNYISTNGKVIGKHKGYPFYTIGQRKGLNIATGTPMYVIEIIPDKNIIVLGTKDELIKTSLKVKNYNLIKYENIPENIEVITKIRYKDHGTVSRLKQQHDFIDIEFMGNVNAIAPGQSAVFYEGKDVVGGGVIV
ncbi:MAG TPA: tRNA 2-thiouridine(34) synthase MnmA [Bacteroidales bacterium]|nr:tRNA 2-thiouridine(34) synthase MnmA [Bacteroidales bacterium]HPS18296.1 tRNA 2-thiouridine(34) synthase MnmA [Bacteroidales bacterium]